MQHTLFYHILQDNDLHRYRIPKHLVDEFTERVSVDASDLTEEEYDRFDEMKYDQYRTLGGPNAMPIYFADKSNTNDILDALASMRNQYCGENGHSYMSAGELAAATLQEYGLLDGESGIARSPYEK